METGSGRRMLNPQLVKSKAISKRTFSSTRISQNERRNSKRDWTSDCETRLGEKSTFEKGEIKTQSGNGMPNPQLVKSKAIPKKTFSSTGISLNERRNSERDWTSDCETRLREKSTYGKVE